MVTDIEIEFDDHDKDSGRLTHTNDIAFSKYIKYLLADIFDNSCIKKCYIATDAFKEIIKFAVKSINQKQKKEYGGFLLGKYLGVKDKEYIVFVDKFVAPSRYAYHDEFRIDFGTTAMIELDLNLQQNPEMCLIGWFHTHPMHTTFLSKFDLNVHDGSFTEPWQIAIVTDTLTPDFETAIFSRKSDGQMNNKTDIKYKISWKK